MTDPVHDVCIGLGSNLGDRLEMLRRAREALRPYVDITACSSVYETTAVDVSEQPEFLNAAIRGTTSLDAMGLLYTARDIEFDIGRRPTFRFGPRLIDVDILLFGQEVRHTPELTLPHRSMHERSFVLKPLAEIAPDWVHPVLGKSIAALLAALPHEEDVKKIGSL